MAIPPPDQWHLLPKKRAEAKAAGALHYFTGKPCRRGHVVPRNVCNEGCTSCRRERRHARREEGIRELGTESYYNVLRERAQEMPSNSGEAKRQKHRRYRARRRAIKHLRVDRRPPNQSKEERKAIKAFENAVRARGNQPDHIVPFFHPQLRGLHTIANLQELTPRQNGIKNNRIMTVEQIQQELETGIRTPEPTEADLKAMVDGGLAVWPEDVDEDYEHTTTPGKVNWANYPQHMVTDNE